MPPRRLRVYADTSVYGGAFDDEFSDASRAFFDRVTQGRFRLVISALVRDELLEAPERVRQFFDELRVAAEIVETGEDALRLRDAYLTAGAVTEASATDALHVALATVADCRVIVSWNFRHIVNFHRIPLYNGVNQSLGYGVLGIHSPQEVLADEE
jgi:predicted nucleic acid-binding protein